MAISTRTLILVASALLMGAACTATSVLVCSFYDHPNRGTREYGVLPPVLIRAEHWGSTRTLSPIYSIQELAGPLYFRDMRGWPWRAASCEAEVVAIPFGFTDAIEHGYYRDATCRVKGGRLISRDVPDVQMGPVRDVRGCVRVIPLTPIWTGVLLDILFFSLVSVLALPLAILAIRTARLGYAAVIGVSRLQRGLCPACAYPVGGSPVCTECGTRHSQMWPEHRYGQR